MLTIKIKKFELFDEDRQEFISFEPCDITLEHSLISISKWESKWNKSFLSSKDKSKEEIIDYIRCMTINKNIPDNVFLGLSNDNFREINEYISAPMTATWFNEANEKKSREIITSELIYYWMISFNIPLECQKWHINRLLTLIRVCAIKNSPDKKMSRKDILNQNKLLNAKRKAALRTKG